MSRYILLTVKHVTASLTNYMVLLIRLSNGSVTLWNLVMKCKATNAVDVTPYMHCMVYHVPQMLRRYGNIKQFSGQGRANLVKRHHLGTLWRLVLLGTYIR